MFSAIKEKYLTLMRVAVKKGKSQAGQLALLEDRVVLNKVKNKIAKSHF